MPRDDKVAILKDSLAAIGRRIEAVLAQKQAAGEDRERWRRHLWTYVDWTVHSFCCADLLLFQFRDPLLAKESQSFQTRRDPCENGHEGGCTALNIAS